MKKEVKVEEMEKIARIKRDQEVWKYVGKILENGSTWGCVIRKIQLRKGH